MAYPVAGFRIATDLQPSSFFEKRRKGKAQPASGPWLVPAEGPGATGTMEFYEQRYPVFTARWCHDLHRRFARLGRVKGDRRDRAILELANRYGWLDTGAERWHLEPRRARPFSNLDCPRRERLHPWRRSACEAAALIAFWDLVRDGRPGEVAKHVFVEAKPHRIGVFLARRDGRLTTDRSLDVDWRTVTYGGEPDPVVDERGDDGPYLFHAFPAIAGPRPDAMEVARLFLYDRVNEKLVGRVTPQLRAERAPGESFLLYPHSLLTAIYLHFARELAGRRAPGVPCANPKCDRTVDPEWGRRYCNSACRDQARYWRDPEKRRGRRSGTPIRTPEPVDGHGSARTEQYE